MAGRVEGVMPWQAAAGVADLLAFRARTTPEAVALAVAGGGELSFEAWEVRSNAAARGLAAAGVGPGSAVGLLFDGDGWTDFGIAYVAVLKAGAAAVPLGRG